MYADVMPRTGCWAVVSQAVLRTLYSPLSLLQNGRAQMVRRARSACPSKKQTRRGLSCPSLRVSTMSFRRSGHEPEGFRSRDCSVTSCVMYEVNCSNGRPESSLFPSEWVSYSL